MERRQGESGGAAGLGRARRRGTRRRGPGRPGITPREPPLAEERRSPRNQKGNTPRPLRPLRASGASGSTAARGAPRLRRFVLRPAIFVCPRSLVAALLGMTSDCSGALRDAPRDPRRRGARKTPVTLPRGAGGTSSNRGTGTGLERLSSLIRFGARRGSRGEYFVPTGVEGEIAPCGGSEFGDASHVRAARSVGSVNDWISVHLDRPTQGDSAVSM